MSELDIQELFRQEKRTLQKYIVYPVIVGMLLMISGAGWMYLSKIQMNTNSIRLLDASKINNEDFNSFIRIQNQINILQEERIKILQERANSQDEVNKEVFNMLHSLDVQIEVLKEKNKKILSYYQERTRDGGFIEIGLELMYKDSLTNSILACNY